MSSDSHNNSNDDSFEDSETYRQGLDGEGVVEEFVNEHGWWVDAAKKYNRDGAPTLQREQEHIVRPDLLVSKGGVTRYIEVKDHSEPSYYRKTGEYQHAIDRRHWRAYHDAQQTTGLETWLFIYEEDRDSLLRSRIDDLTVDHKLLKEDPGWKSYGRDMVFFDRVTFEEVKMSVSDGDVVFGETESDSDGQPSVGETESDSGTNLNDFMRGSDDE